MLLLKNKSFRRMALMFVLLVFSSSLMAANVTIKAKNESLKSVLEKITQQTGYEFAYSNAINPNSIKVNVEVTNQDSDVFFKEFFSKYGIVYKVSGKTISLSKQDIATQQPQQKELKENQKVKISGVVIDENGTSIPGVYVMVMGTKRGTTTDITGKYELDCTVGEKLEYSCMGFKNVEMTVGKSLNPFKNVVMAEDLVALEEAVVIGYGNTQKIKDVTGAISHVGAKAIEQASVGTTITSLLQGRAAGVDVMVQSASPTSPVSVVIRGMSSLSGDNQPLWVIDGIPEYSAGVDGSVANVLYSLNLQDVESIDILKDASATAIYGSRGANGVIVVTTKSGKNGMKPTVEVSSRVGIQFPDFNSYDYFNAAEYKEFMTAAIHYSMTNKGVQDNVIKQFIDQDHLNTLHRSEWTAADLKMAPNAFYSSDTKWLDFLTQKPIQQQYNISVRGGQRNMNYLASFAYNDNIGVVKGGYNKTFSGRVRLEANVNKNMTFRINVSGSSRKASNKDNLISKIKDVRPDLPLYNEDGTIYSGDEFTQNPLLTLQNTNRSVGESIAASLEFEYKFLKDFRFTSRANVNYSNSETLQYELSRHYASTNTDVAASRYWSRPKSDTKVWDNTLLYTKKFGKNDISASLTASMERNQMTIYGMSASVFADDEILNSFSDASVLNNMSETYRRTSLLSQIARVQYNYDSRYLATVTVRRDGSSRFGDGSRWGWFPSFGLGWTITNEKFFKNWNIEDIISFAKFRASHGKSGSQNLSDYQWLSLVGSNQYNEEVGIYPSNIGNNNLRWEEAWMTDIALDLEFWKSRIRTSIGYFQKKSDFLIYSQTLPTSTSFSSITSNLAASTTKGWEFSFDIDIVKNAKWQLTYHVNAATNSTWIDKFNNSTKEYISTYTKLEAGQKSGQWWGYQTYNRLFGSAEEVIALKQFGSNGSITNYRVAHETAGDLYIKDQNGDGVVNATNDKTYLGSQIPKVYGGMGLQLYIGNSLNIGANFSYALGHKRLWMMACNDASGASVDNQSNKMAGMSAVVPQNSPYNPATFPAITPYGDGQNGGSVNFSDYFLYDASYFRLNTINVNYRLGKQYFGNSIVDNIEFSLQAGNLFTITKYPGFDPQGNFAASTSLTAAMGVDNSYYPSARTFTAGVKITFR